MEQWKKLSGYDCDYEISNYGRIKNASSGKILKFKEDIRERDGYIRVRCNLRINGKSSTKSVARLILETFDPIPNSEDYHADHINHDTTDNNLSNLRWLTPEENNINRRTVKYFKEQLKIKDKIIVDLMSKIAKLS